MKMWPVANVKWLGVTDFSKTGYGYYLDNSDSYSYTDGNFADWSKWRFAIYTNLSGKNVTAWGAWGTPTPPPPVRRPDGKIAKLCEHTHVAYGVWLYFDYYSGGKRYTGWAGPLGGGKSGIQVNDYTCTHSVKNPLSPNGDNQFGWGTDVVTLSFPKVGNIFPMIIVGASALSHGALGCRTTGCVNQPWINAYAIPN
jgi:hypothetical protein